MIAPDDAYTRLRQLLADRARLQLRGFGTMVAFDLAGALEAAG